MKKIDFNTKEKIVNSVQKLADAVGSTLGAGGRNALLQIGPQFAITKDGVTVARQIEFEDETENAVAQIVKEAASRTARDAGDGTTTSTVLVYEVVKGILEREDFEKLNVTRLRAGIEAASKELIKNVEASKKEVTDDEKIKSIASISGNNDPKIGDMMLEVYNAVGKEGAVRLEETSMNNTTIDVAAGCQIDSGYINQHFVNNTTKRVADLKKPYVFVTDKKFDGAFKDLLPILEPIWGEKQSPLVIVCGGMEGEPLGTLVANKMQTGMDVVAIEAPYFGVERLDILDDIAAITGAKVVSETRGFNIEDVTIDDFGTADRVVSDAHYTTILGRNGEQEKIDERIEYIKTQQEEDKHGSMAWRYNQRMASLTSGVGVIYVGGNSEAEMQDMYYRLEDALAATKAALNHGYVTGGGMAYYNAAKGVFTEKQDSSFQVGFNAMLEAAMKPVEWIARNAGHQGPMPDGLGDKGYNAVTCTLSDLEADGIIDPYKVVESCISNAASVAGMLITTNVIITDERRKK